MLTGGIEHKEFVADCESSFWVDNAYGIKMLDEGVLEHAQVLVVSTELSVELFPCDSCAAFKPEDAVDHEKVNIKA